MTKRVTLIEAGPAEYCLYGHFSREFAVEQARKFYESEKDVAERALKAIEAGEERVYHQLKRRRREEPQGVDAMTDHDNRDAAMSDERLEELRELHHGSADGMIRELLSEIDRLRSKRKALEESASFCASCGQLLPSHHADCGRWPVVLEDLQRQNDDLRAQLTRCREENTREVERRRAAEHKLEHMYRLRDKLETEIGQVQGRLALTERERDELKARFAEPDR